MLSKQQKRLKSLYKKFYDGIKLNSQILLEIEEYENEKELQRNVAFVKNFKSRLDLINDDINYYERELQILQAIGSVCGDLEYKTFSDVHKYKKLNEDINRLNAYRNSIISKYNYLISDETIIEEFKKRRINE